MKFLKEKKGSQKLVRNDLKFSCISIIKECHVKAFVLKCIK